MTQSGSGSQVSGTPAQPGANVVSTQVFTRRDIDALRQRGEELSNQLQSAAGRRRSTRESMRDATGADKAGLEQRLGVLDARIAGLERDIEENGKLLSSMPASLAQVEVRPDRSSNRPADRIMDNLVPMVVVFTIFVMAPIALSIARMFWKRGNLPRQAPPNPEHTQRLERMEQAIDSIAIEIERVSEGQRFVTRILSEGKQGVPLAPGQAAPAAERLGIR